MRELKRKMAYVTFCCYQDAFDSIVLDGALLDKGIPSWAQVVSGEDAEAIRAFIVSMANQ